MNTHVPASEAHTTPKCVTARGGGVRDVSGAEKTGGGLGTCPGLRKRGRGCSCFRITDARDREEAGGRAQPSSSPGLEGALTALRGQAAWPSAPELAGGKETTGFRG